MIKSKCVSILSLSFICSLAIFGNASGSTTASIRSLNSYYTDYDGTYYCDYESKEDLVAASNELDQEIAAEGMVLLKNDGTLPFKGVKNVTILGKNSVNPYNGASSVTSNTRGIYDSLEAAGYHTNPIIKQFYEDDSRSGADRTAISFLGSGHYTVGETDIDDYDKAPDVIDSFGNYGDAAVVVLTRLGGESSLDPERVGVWDHASDSVTDSEKGYLQLSKNEKDMIALAKNNFDKIVVVLNCPSQIEVSELDKDEAINGIILAGVPGTSGFMALGKILNGEVNPSGHLTDTFPTVIADMPSSQNFGDTLTLNRKDSAADWHVKDSDGNPISSDCTPGIFLDNQIVFDSYEEGIYVGYRYYETMFDLQGDNGDTWYKNNVLYPFGHGLTYTTFDYSDINWSGNAATDNQISVSLTVTNSGKVAGKEVVQVYYSAPYTAGGIEKSAVNLSTFAKTNMLEPGESEEVTLSFNVQDMASYDFDDSNGNGFYGYELDPGTYTYSLRSDSHTIINSKTDVISAGKTYRNDRVTGQPVYNEFSKKLVDKTSANGTPTTTDNKYSTLPRDKDGLGFTEMSRSNLDSFKAVSPTAEETKLKSGSDLQSIINHHFSLADLDTDEAKLYGQHKDKPANDDLPTQADAGTTAAAKIQLKDMKNIDPTTTEGKKKWNEFLDQLTFNELLTIIGQGGWSTAELSRIGKDHGIELDSPEGITPDTIYPGGVGLATTWNLELAAKKGRMIGNECLLKGQNAWYGPGMNMHRNPYGARNYQYYSEDPFISGMFAVVETKAVATKGINTYVKHFAMNDSESHRFGVITYATEQAMREIYLKPFQMCIEEGGALGVMASFPRIGLYESAINKPLLVNVLRDEWQFKGIAETDAFVGSNTSSYHNNVSLPSNGLNLVLGTTTPESYTTAWTDFKQADPETVAWNDNDKVLTYTNSTGTHESWSQYLAIRESAMWCLSVWSNVTYLKNGIDTTKFADATVTAYHGAKTNKSIAVSLSELGASRTRYELSSGTLPAGLTLAANGTISGTTTAANGNYVIKVNMIADGWVKKEATVTIKVTDAIGYTGSDMKNAASGVAFSGKFTADCLDTTKYTEGIEISVADDKKLPGGITVAKDGTISGTPLVAGTYTFTVKATGFYMGTNWMGFPQKQSDTFTQEYTIVVPADEYTVTFDMNYDGADDITQNVEDGSSVTPITSPTRTGYIFTGWYSDAACTKAADLNAGITKNTTLYAGWYEIPTAPTTSGGNTSSSVTTSNSTSADESKGGCGGSIAVTGSIIGGLALLGLGLVLKKKREDK